MCTGEASTSEATRRALVAAAVDEVARCGWRGATSRRITRRAGVNLALITYHFGSKSELLHAALRSVVAEGSDMLRRVIAAGEADVALLVELAESEEAGQVARFLLAATREAVDDPELKATMGDVLVEMRTSIAAALGLPGDDPRVPLVAAAVDGLMMHRLIDPEVDVRAAIATLRDVLVGHPPASPSLLTAQTETA